jgi:short subunit dehydrogenase-like uncharacterized protein
MIAVYGATGKLGRLVTARFDDAGATTTLIGRSPAALSRLATSAGPRRTSVAPIDDPAALERALEGCSVLVNCAPAEICGERLVRAALDSGIHYVDAAVEQSHIRRFFEKYDEEARQCDVAIVPALGFDYAIGDCLAHLAAQSHQPASTVAIAYGIEGADTNGTNAGAAATNGREVVYRDGGWRAVPLELDRAWFEFPDPIGRRRMSRYAAGEVITVPRHVKTQAVNTLITSASICPYSVLLPILSVIRPLIGLVRRTAAGAVLGTVAAVVAGARAAADAPPDPSAAPPTDDRRFVVAAEVHAIAGSIGRARAVGGNLQRVTAAILTRGALWLAEGSVVAGVHSAATAFAPHALLDSLASEGVTWSSDA